MFFNIIFSICCFVLSLRGAAASDSPYYGIMSTGANSFIYSENGFTNLTANNMGYEFEPFGKAASECIEHINSLAASGECFIAEIGGGYGRFSRQVFRSVENKENIHYDFCDLDRTHTLTAMRIFSLEIGQQNIDFITADAVDHLLTFEDNSCDVIVAFNIFHYVPPIKLVSLCRAIYEKLKPGGRLFCNAMTPYYNIQTETLNSIKPGPIPLIPEEELSRQIFEYFVEKNQPFPGFFRTSHINSSNLLNQEIMETILTAFSLEPLWIEEFSLAETPEHIPSGRRWLAFEAIKEGDIESKRSNEVFMAAFNAESRFKRTNWKDKYPNIDPNTMYQCWFSYMGDTIEQTVSKWFSYINLIRNESEPLKLRVVSGEYLVDPKETKKNK